MNISHDNESAKMLMFSPFKQLCMNVVKFKNLTLQNFVCLSASLTAIMGLHPKPLELCSLHSFLGLSFTHTCFVLKAFTIVLH